ncbi:MAG: ABC transporter permease [Vicinamibacterales bacterium]
MRLPDVSLAVRNLARRPGFAVAAILLLALGAGANAAVLSVVRGVLLKPLDYRQPEQLVAWGPHTFVSTEEVIYWRGRTRSFEDIAFVSPGWMMALVADGLEPRNVTGGRTSDNFFTTLGVEAAIGRPLLPGDFATGNAHAAVISAELYRVHFHSDPRTIGRAVQLDGAPYEIVGVMPPAFEFLGPGTDIWAPLPMDAAASNYKAQFSQAFARVRPGITVAGATSELQTLLPSMRQDLAKTADWGRDIHVAPLQDIVIGDLRTTLVILLAAVGLILLLAAVNLGTLVLGRSIGRARELAVRTALGASRGQLVRQLVTEQAVLAVLGATAGLLLARLSLPLLVRALPPEIPRQNDIALDAVVFVTVLGVSVMVAVLLAFKPVVIAARSEMQPLLRQTPSTETPARRRALGTLVAAQIALAIVLGIGAGLMLRSLWNLQRIDSGFDATRILAFRLQTTSKYSSLATGLPYFERVVARVRALPGVTSVGSIQHLPMTGYNWTTQAYRIDRPPAAGQTPPAAIWRFIGWDYFASMGIRVRAGRAFTNQDHDKAPAVAIVNEALARREFGEPAAAIGRRLVNVNGRGTTDTEIVGVVGDVRFRSLDKASEPEVYRPLAQTFMFPMGFVVRTNLPPAQFAAAVRQAAYDIDPAVPVAEMQPLTALIAGTLGRPRLLALLLSVFAAIGLALGIVGVYGVVACRVRQQEREFGIRLALGARPDRVARTVLRQGAMFAAAGLVIGLPAAFGLAHLMDSVIFGVTAHDPLTFIALPATVVLATLSASIIPALRASRVDPGATMRESL